MDREILNEAIRRINEEKLERQKIIFKHITKNKKLFILNTAGV